MLEQIVDRMTVGPVLPATILVGLLVLYTIVAMIGLIDLDLDVPDLDLDTPDLDADGVDLDVLGGIGGAALRWVNLGRVPMIIWGGVFTVVYWSVSYSLWHHFDAERYQPTILATTLLAFRNVVLSTLATKFITSPLIKHFAPTPQYDTAAIVGGTGEVVSIEATPKFGQVKFRTHAAPLLLNVRTDGDQTIPKGTEVRIVAFDSASRVYRITPIELETVS